MTMGVATPEDAEAVTEVSDLAIAFLRKTYRPKKVTLINKPWESSLRIRWVALMHDRVVGTVQYAVEEDCIHLIGFLDHRHFQRQGVARKLVQFLKDIGRREGVRWLCLNTVKETGNVVIFERLGFEVISEGEDHKSESDRYERLTDVYMEMPIERRLPR